MNEVLIIVHTIFTPFPGGGRLSTFFSGRGVRPGFRKVRLVN